MTAGATRLVDMQQAPRWVACPRRSGAPAANAPLERRPRREYVLNRLRCQAAAGQSMRDQIGLANTARLCPSAHQENFGMVAAEALDAAGHAAMSERSRQCFAARFPIDRAAQRLVEIIREQSR